VAAVHGLGETDMTIVAFAVNALFMLPSWYGRRTERLFQAPVSNVTSAVSWIVWRARRRESWSRSSRSRRSTRRRD
jgi:hypothetical protein